MKYNTNSEINSAILAGDHVRVAHLVRSGEDLEKPDTFGRSALLNATIEGQNEVVELLIEHDANVCTIDLEHWTALHFAAQNYDPKICQILLDAGATIDAANSHGNSPLWVAEMRSAGRTELQGILIAYGANRFLKNNSGISPNDLRNG